MSDLLLLALSETFDDVQNDRKRLQNRIGAHSRAGHGHDLILAGLFKRATDYEKAVAQELQAVMGAHPLGDFFERTPGLGLLSGARLLGALGDPLWNMREDRPRRDVAELWAYCGLHVINGARPRRRRGELANWNSKAKTKAIVIATTAFRSGGPYREYALQVKAACEGKVHQVTCRNTVYSAPNHTGARPTNGCGTTAHPEWGEIGSPWRPGHVHQHAISVTAKKILEDLFLEAKRLAGHGSPANGHLDRASRADLDLDIADELHRHAKAVA